MFVQKTRANKVDEIDGWCQFHQHLTRSFFIPKCFLMLFVLTICACNVLAKGNWQKAARKMLVKLTKDAVKFSRKTKIV